MPTHEQIFRHHELHAPDHSTGGSPIQPQGSDIESGSSRPMDRITQIDNSLDTLWQKYEKDNNFKTAERENGQALLQQLHATPEARTVIKACAILDDIILEQRPKDVLTLPDVIPSITQAISQVRAESVEKQLDLKTELITIHSFLETLQASDEDVYSDDPENGLGPDFYDKTFSDLLNSVSSAIKYF